MPVECPLDLNNLYVKYHSPRVGGQNQKKSQQAKSLSWSISNRMIRVMGFWQRLPFSWTTLRGKHCWHPIAVMGVIDTFRRTFVPSDFNHWNALEYILYKITEYLLHDQVLVLL